MPRPTFNTVDDFAWNGMPASGGSGDGHECISTEDFSIAYASFWIRSGWFGWWQFVKFAVETKMGWFSTCRVWLALVASS